MKEIGDEVSVLNSYNYQVKAGKKIINHLNVIPPHFIHEINTNSDDVIAVNVFQRKEMRFVHKKG